ncbi:histidine kinase [Cohnella xylanilytica]|uniref:histidine kinase n=1 Tax=Cohnella xylanilytica TaxID=557555 RepID=A0A841TS94_9BACL|nr:histidine kinase [Cohnella xylanilytica]MBB6691287.1 sensor histidine kinase [Cohnella xylanilytica]GIO12838.1 histidine kinase [Cohnella xylanilytica]
MPHPFKSGTLRRTLVVYLLIACLFPPILFSVYTYSSLHSILTNKIRSGIDASLKQEATGLENVFNVLDFVSKQFALDGHIADLMNRYLTTDRTYDKAVIKKDIEESMNVVNFTNPNLGLTVYYMPDAPEPVLFTNLTVSPQFGIEGLPPFVQYRGASYFGPHRTQFKDSDNTVFSSVRVVRTDQDRAVYIYLETNSNLFGRIMNDALYGMKVSHYLIGQDGKTLFADEGTPPIDPASLPWEMARSDERASLEPYHGYYLFGYDSPQGWKLVTAVSKSAFNKEIDIWLRRMAILFVGAFGFAIVLAMLIWRKVYGSIRKVNREIVRMTGDREAPVQMMNVEEFDQLLGNFQVMKTTVNDLIAEIGDNERMKYQLETEKLLSQINPHFLHNTLNTVQWVARANGQEEIDTIVTLLVKVLQYNMGKKSLIVTVREEIEALGHYLELQRYRYEDELRFRMEVDPAAENFAIPRFLLQPLVENAIYHGKSEEDGEIVVTVTRTEPDGLRLQVADNGPGMDEETIRRLFDEDGERPRRGMGIGLRYVKRLLVSFYGSGELLRIRSAPGRGTVLTVDIPTTLNEVRRDDQSFGSR